MQEILSIVAREANTVKVMRIVKISFDFRSVEVSVESFSKFVNGILRKHDTDELHLQLQVEKLAWDMVKFDFDKFTCPKIDRKLVLFRLFCLFNRFSDSTQVIIIEN